jgi:hypothetical protein
MVGFAHTWGEHRVFFRKPGDQRVHSMPASRTDVQELDPIRGSLGWQDAVPGRGSSRAERPHRGARPLPV